MPNRTLPLLKAAFTFLLAPAIAFSVDTTPDAMNRFVEQYCIQCHGGEKVKGKVDFTTISMDAAGEDDFDFWQLAAEVVEYEDMPPEDEKQPSPEERAAFQAWYESHYVDVEATPGVFQPRRLSTPEYRHTMRSLFGFDLENNVQKAEQTAVEPSLILKLMPTDPPGESGFINDTDLILSAAVLDRSMGRRKSAKKAPVKKAQPKVPTTFDCPFCNSKGQIKCEM